MGEYPYKFIMSCLYWRGATAGGVLGRIANTPHIKPFSLITFKPEVKIQVGFRKLCVDKV